jgi:hypothetical protein
VAAPQVIGALAGLLLIGGLWTPVAGVVTACAEAGVAFSSPAHAGIPAVLAVFARMTYVPAGPRGSAGPSVRPTVAFYFPLKVVVAS